MYKSFFKRILDLFIAFTVVLILSPVYIISWFILMIVNDGLPFFTQNRVGKNGEIFMLIKFRSMNNKKDDTGVLLKDVERLTPFGKFIRKTSIDELPQVFNIFKGDMSVIGPRPLLTEYLPYYSEYHSQRHNIRPGITGLAQVTGRNGLKFSERFNLDVHYVQNFSFLLDISILVKTFMKFFKPSEIKIGRPMSEIDDIGITKGLSSNYFNKEKNEN